VTRLLAITAVATCVAGVGTRNSAPGQIHKYDFGPPEGIRADGFIAVAGTDLYTNTSGRGFRRERPHSYDSNGGVGVVHLGPVTRDFVLDPEHFVLALEDGAYRVAVVTGLYTRYTVSGSLMQAFNDTHWVRQRGRELYSRPMTIDRYFAADGLYFKAYHTFFRPEQSLWDRYLAHYFPVARFEVEVTGQKLELEFSKNFPLCGLIIYPKTSEREGDASVEAFIAGRREEFDGHYIRVPAIESPEPYSATVEEEQAGMILFSRHPMEDIYPETFPHLDEIGRPLRAVVARGSTVSVQLGVVPTADLETLTPSASDLVGPQRLSSEVVRFRYARYAEALLDREHSRRYAVRSQLLTEQLTVPADVGVARAFYATIAIPADARPGIYRGRVAIHSAAAKTASVPLELRVLPFELPQPSIALGAYYSNPFTTRLRAFTFSRSWNPDLYDRQKREYQALARAQMHSHFAMMRKIGLNYVSTTAPWRPLAIDESGKLRPNHPSHDQLIMIGDAVRDAGFRQFSFFGGGWTVLLNDSPHFLTRRQAEQLPEAQIVFPEAARKPAAKLIEGLYQLGREREWPRMHFYASDELGNMGIRGRTYGRELARFLSSLRPLVGEDFKLVASAMRFARSEPMLPYLDILMPGRFWPLRRQTLDAVRNAGVEPWSYNLGSSRLSYGYYLWRIGLKGRSQWSYDGTCSHRDPVFGLSWGGEPPRANSSVAPGMQSVPSRRWFINFREGIEDFRYLQLLEQELAENPVGPAAERARAVLQELSSRIDEEYLSPRNDWSPWTYDYFRWQVTQAIMAFDERG
jgi:hypothetical protein